MKLEAPNWRPSDSVLRLFSLISFGVFGTSVVAHVLSFLPGVVPLSWAWSIHIVTFIPFGARVFALTGRTRRQAQGLLLGQTESASLWLSLEERLNGTIPMPVRISRAGLIIYGVINFVFVVPRWPNVPEHLKIRAFSSSWMIFAFISLVYFYWAEPGLRRLEKDEPHDQRTVN